MLLDKGRRRPWRRRSRTRPLDLTGILWPSLGYPALALVLFLGAFLMGAFLLGSMWFTDRKARPTEDRDPL